MSRHYFTFPEGGIFRHYQVWIQLINNKKGIFAFHTFIAEQTSLDEAVFVQRFIDLWEWGEGMSHDEDGIPIVPREFVKPLGMTVNRFRTIVRKWEEFGIIRTLSKGLPLKKWYRLNERNSSRPLLEEGGGR